MKVKCILFFFSLLVGFALSAKNVSKSELKAESNFYKVKEVKYSFQKGKEKKKYTSDETRIWYSFFPALENASEKPLFVMLNGGPGCATTTNLFAMNTAPYTLDKEIIGDEKLSAPNEHNWQKIGNLLYIDAPNTGFSYMVNDTDNQAEIVHSFLGGANFNAFIDADQVLRTVLHFANKQNLKKNKIIFVGESYSGVRVSTILNLVLFYSQYEKGEKVFKDQELCHLIEEYLGNTIGSKAKKPYSPEEISKIFSNQILIQPQIVDSYQAQDAAEEFKKSNSIMKQLEKQAHSKKTWETYIKESKGDVNTAALIFLHDINRDQYNCMKPATWSDDLEAHSSLALRNFDELSKITDTKIETLYYMLPAERGNALRYMLDKKTTNFLQDPIVKELVGIIDPTKKVFLELFPFSSMYPPDVEQNGRTLGQVLGGLNEYDNYLIGTNVYIFLGFMANAGIQHRFKDIFGISPGSSTIYGQMFLENLSVVDTFMTDAKYDLVVYSSTLPSQFDNKKGRFTNIVSDLEVVNGDIEKDGYFTIYYNKNSVNGLSKTPEFRIVKWPHYEISGHSVSTTQAKKLLEDVNKWLNELPQK